jgi:serine/threonine-protein kinase
MPTMEAQRRQPDPVPAPRVDWEAFYRSYRKPGYLPGFEIVNKLGGGMFGLVFKARKESIGKDYAIKFLKVDDDTVRDAVMREIDNVSFFAQIDHPNLVSIEDKGTVDGIPYLVMSYAGEDTLQKRLASGGMTREQALDVFVQAARGVQALHDHSLVHFDLKPANIFLKGDVARVGDYGLSKLVTASRNSLSFGRGTPYYMAPEMLQRRGDARSDIYSLGILLYECLYGDVPFRGDSEWEVLKKHEVATPEFPPHASAADRAIVLRCLQKRPEDRFASVAELLRALQAPVALGDSLVLAPAPSCALPAPSMSCCAIRPRVPTACRGGRRPRRAARSVLWCTGSSLWSASCCSSCCCRCARSARSPAAASSGW